MNFTCDTNRNSEYDFYMASKILITRIHFTQRNASYQL